jgi:thymidylate kinase
MTVRFTCIVGIDGSGKTTLAKDLAQEIGPRTQYLYLRYQPVLLRPALRILRKAMRNYSFSRGYSDYEARKVELWSRHGVLSRIFRALLLVDYFLQLQWKLAPARLTRAPIVADRYFHDTVITDLAIDFNLSEAACERILNGLHSVLFQPDVVIYLDVSPEIAMSRKSDIPDISYLTVRKRYYDYLARAFGWHVVDARRSAQIVRQDALKILRSCARPPLDRRGHGK